MKRKLIVGLMMATMVLSFTGCKDKSNQNTNQIESTSSETTYEMVDAETLVKEAFGEDDPYFKFRVEKTQDYLDNLEVIMAPENTEPGTYDLGELAFEGSDPVSYRDGIDGIYDLRNIRSGVAYEEVTYMEYYLTFHKVEGVDAFEENIRASVNIEADEKQVKLNDEIVYFIHQFDDSLPIEMMEEKLTEIVNRRNESGEDLELDFYDIEGKKTYELFVQSYNYEGQLSYDFAIQDSGECKN